MALMTLALVDCGAAPKQAELSEPPTLLPLVPEPVERTVTDGVFILNEYTRMDPAGASEEEAALYKYLGSKLLPSQDAHTRTPSGGIALRISPKEGFHAEGYTLAVTPDSVVITGQDRAGLFYGIQTFLQLLSPQVLAGDHAGGGYGIPCQQITDYPRFDYRGFHFDVARTFSDKETVLRVIDYMAHHKLNKLHWHIADDEGWRIRLDCYPELAEIGGFRGGDSPVQPIYGEWDKKYGGYYTKDDVREILEYAAMRSVDVIPEIDLPGHSRTAAKVFPHILCGVGTGVKSTTAGDRRNVWCAAKESNYVMLEKILTEICELFPSKYMHIGGDEVQTGQWEKCPDCQALKRKLGYSKTIEIEDYFIKRLAEFVHGLGKTPFVWDEAVATGRMPSYTHVSGWQTVATARKSAEKYPTVVQPGSWFYIDMKQSRYEDGLTWAGLVDPKRVYSFSFTDNAFTEAQMKNVIGVEAAFWTELLLSHDPSYLWYHIYPSLCAVAEIGWSQQEKRDWDDFYRRLTTGHLDRLGAMGIPYRQFPPVVDYVDGVITVTPPFAGAEIRYTTDGHEPDEGSPVYENPITDPVAEKYLFRAFYDGVGSASITPSGKSPARIAANSTETFSVPLPSIINSDGTWYLRINSFDDNLKLNKATITGDGVNATIIGGTQRVDPMSRIRIRATTANRKGTMNITIRNENAFACAFDFEFEKSTYIEPTVTMTSSLGASEKFPFKNATDYNFASYSRTSSTCRKGDHITFTFASPVDAGSIEVHTGLSYLPRYHIPNGRVQTSTDGATFKDVATLHAGKATIFPTGKVKAVRIVSDSDGNGESAVAIQDLKVRPKE